MIQESENEWWGFSQDHGWVVLDWNDHRNRPGFETPRRLYLIRCRDWAEAPIRWSDWSPPAYTSVEDQIAAQAGADRRKEFEKVEALQKEFYSLHSRLEAIRPLHPRYIPFPVGKRLFDLCASLNLEALYHITHVENLPGILTDGLLCHHRAKPTRDISNAEIQQHRADKQIPGLNGMNLHDCVPLFLAPRPPMLSGLRDVQGDIIYLLVSTDALLRPQAVFTDGNARSNGTRFFQNIDDLSGLDWELLRARYWNHNDPVQHRENKRLRSAEVLVPEGLPRACIDRIVVMTAACQQRVAKALGEAGIRVPVAVRPELYYPSHSQPAVAQPAGAPEAGDEIPF